MKLHLVFLSFFLVLKVLVSAQHSLPPEPLLILDRQVLKPGIEIDLPLGEKVMFDAHYLKPNSKITMEVKVSPFYTQKRQFRVDTKGNAEDNYVPPDVQKENIPVKITYVTPDNKIHVLEFKLTVSSPDE
ncbi:MAG: hypothetical protein RML72_13060 [Bacteroidia bacterium]|nr:hypothetical protein [Bacteroidia bacterium]MDW8159788.1 hypothetical protein [Bacteroidia bacterium]